MKNGPRKMQCFAFVLKMEFVAPNISVLFVCRWLRLLKKSVEGLVEA